MVKKRNAGNNNYNGGEGYAASNKGCVAGGGNYDRFSVYEFAGDDLRVETESFKTLAKFGPTRSPARKPVLSRLPVDKYVFLESFTKGTTQQKDSGSDVFDVDATDGPSQNDTNGTDMIVSPGSLNFDLPCSFLKQQDYERSSCHTKSHGPGAWKLGGYTTSKKHKKVWYVDSEEDGWINLGSSSSFDHAENEGSSKKQSSEYEANNSDCETVVVIAPYYAKYANKHYASCRLLFSQRCIRLETPQGERNRTNCLEWLTFDVMKIEHQQCESAKVVVVNLFLKSKFIDVADAGNWSSGSEQLEFVCDDSEWPGKLAEIKLLDPKYEAAWETIKNECHFDESFGGIIYPDGDPDAVFISRKDIELLQPRTFINDTIIDFYIKYLVNNAKPEKQGRFHFFNTFFFKKLLDMGRDLDRSENGDAFRHVRKWTRNVHIFEKDFIFIPVNFSLHWSLIVICHPGEVANTREKNLNSLIRMPCILHMDSIRGSHGGRENLIRRYLWEEWKERGYKQEEDISKSFLNLDFITLQVPQQENLFDCGLFLLHYAELFLEEDFGAIKYFKSLNQDWFLAAEVSLKKRDHIKKLIHEIAEGRQNHNKQFESGGRNQGDSKSSDEFEIREQQSFMDTFEDNRSVNKDNFQPDKLLVTINLFPSLTLLMEDTIGNHKTSLPTAGHTSSRCEAKGDNDPIPERYPLISNESGKMKVSRETSSSGSPIIIDVQNDDDCVSEVTSSFERQGTSHSNPPLSISDLETCVVEDSEEECETENIRKARKPPTFLIQ